MDIEALFKQGQVTSYLYRLSRLLDDFEIEPFVEEFTDDGSYKLIPRENYERGMPVHIIDDTKARLRYRKKLIFEHWHYEKFRENRALSNIQVDFPAPDVANSTCNFAVYHTDAEGFTELNLVGVFEDSLVFRDERWRIKDRLGILDSYTPREAIVVPP